MVKDTDETRSHLVHGYNQYISRNRSTKGGGIMIQTQSDFTLISENDSKFDEAVTVKRNQKMVTTSV